MIDLLDSDILVIEDVLKRLEAGTTKSRDLEGFRKEVIERFGLAGFVVRCDVYESNVPGMYVPEISILDKTADATVFDHDRMTWEVQHDILGIDTPGALTPDGTIITPSKSVAFIDKKD
jgi:hypothetical protein